MQCRRHVYYSGHVQGVGFRVTACRLARGRGVGGFVRNLRDGRVEVVAEGDEAAVARFLADLEDRMGRSIESVEALEEPATGTFDGFDVSLEGA
jgi:acylphosphatase